MTRATSAFPASEVGVLTGDDGLDDGRQADLGALAPAHLTRTPALRKIEPAGKSMSGASAHTKRAAGGHGSSAHALTHARDGRAATTGINKAQGRVAPLGGYAAVNNPLELLESNVPSL